MLPEVGERGARKAQRKARLAHVIAANEMVIEKTSNDIKQYD
ncbi:hypothetical protein [Frateuria sp. STR12]|nr:hypothetical protein [Frateuria sp. STR12]MCX7512573.1 hypothetical protein [Frateuria sp. STR12]